MIPLSRTFAGKTAHYSPDGYGRDSYILTDNGGIFKKGFITALSKNHPNPNNSPPRQPRIYAKLARYSSNGTGRDSYININSGGLLSQYGSKPFHTTLRKWSPIKLINTNDMLYKTQHKWLMSRSRKNPGQEAMTSRLSAPKSRLSDSPQKSSVTSKRLILPNLYAKNA
ncbi:hypothetical protein SteCoe_5818 [Stentor coeruleus]|uniref:Uncharacterized protein n=1 Tax=Stentor coeruleus TaxID=5963 RepID=A0A1R2CRE5_9CILI|nr:hypothetical protein SteCoe_5818 [Stentor coeruleus]